MSINLLTQKGLDLLFFNIVSMNLDALCHFILLSVISILKMFSISKNDNTELLTYFSEEILSDEAIKVTGAKSRL